MGKISKKTCKKFIFIMLFIVLITLVGIFFYRNREGLEVNKVGTATGGWGGSCTCPDGQVYQVSDNGTSGRELACYGGVSGKVNRFSGPWSGKSVTCAPKVKDSEPKGPTLKDYVYNSVNQKLTDPTPPEAPGCYILLPDGCPNHPTYKDWTAKKNIWQLDEPSVLPKSSKNEQLCNKRAQDFNGWCNIKNAQSFFRK